MIFMWESLGPIKYPLAFSLVAVALLSGWSAIRLALPSGWSELRTKVWIDAILFWGGFAMVAGVLGTLVGIILAAQSIEAAGAVSTPLLWGGIKVALISSALGFVILAVASISWFALQLRWRLTMADDAEEAV